MLARAQVDLRCPPSDFDGLVEWFDQFCSNLVLLEEYPLNDVRSVVEEFATGLARHIERADLRAPSSAPRRSEGRALLDSDHERFSVSLEQLRWSYDLLEVEDHGGHRQALGQYGRLLAESVRRHREDERSYHAEASARGSARSR